MTTGTSPCAPEINTVWHNVSKQTATEVVSKHLEILRHQNHSVLFFQAQMIMRLLCGMCMRSVLFLVFGYWTVHWEIIVLQHVAACVSVLPACCCWDEVGRAQLWGIMKGWHGPCSRTKVVKDKRNSKSVNSEVLNIFYSMTCEYKPKSSAGLSSLLLNCGEREEGDDLSAILLQRNFHLACWSRWWGIIVCCEIP